MKHKNKFREIIEKYITLFKNKEEENEEQLKEEKDINLGVNILRVIYCFLVIVVHFGNGEIYNFAMKYIDFYVTSFFFMAFYFSYRTFSSRNVEKIKERFLKLFFPYFLWPIISFIRQNPRNINISTLFNRNVLKSFYFQYLLGNNIYGILWFLFDLIIVSIFICIISLMFKGYHLYVLFLVFILNTIYNFFRLHPILLEGFSRHPIKQPLEMMNEVPTFAIIGYTLGHFDILNRLKKLNKYIFIFFSPIFYIVRWHQEVFDFFPRFNVIFNTIFISCIFIFFGTLPFHLCKIKFLKNILKIITSHTGGIYYMHIEAFYILLNGNHFVSPRTIKGCIILYICCFIICDIGTRIFKKWRFRYLFN